MGFGKDTLRVHTMYGSDGKLRTSYFEGDAAKVAKKNVKAFNKELARYERDFENYASLDIDSAKIMDKNTKYVFGKLNIAEKYLQYIPTGDMAQSLGDETTAIAGNKSAFKLGIGAKIANVFQPFFEEQAKKHPRLQGLSDNITRAANGGRLPLTADSAAVMKIAFDKKYYNDCRRPGADKAALKEQYDTAIFNLMDMAALDGVDEKQFSEKIGEKLIQQMQVDESITHIYEGMSTGQIRLGEDKPVLNSKGEEIKINGKTLYKRANNFVGLDGKQIDCLNLSPREPQSIEDILSEYQNKLDKYAKSCNSEAMFRRMLSSDSYQNIERTARAFAEVDCPDEAEKFRYELTRANIESCKKWAIENDNKSPYAQLVVPPKFDEITQNDDFVQGYATSDYYDINGTDDMLVIDDKYKSDEDLAQSLREEMTGIAKGLADIEQMKAMFAQLKAENAELRRQLELVNAEPEQVSASISDASVSNVSISSKSPEPVTSGDNTSKSDGINISDTSAVSVESVIDTSADSQALQPDNIGDNQSQANGCVSFDKGSQRKYLEDIARRFGSTSSAIMPPHSRLDSLSPCELIDKHKNPTNASDIQENHSLGNKTVASEAAVTEVKSNAEVQSEAQTGEAYKTPVIAAPEADVKPQASSGSKFSNTSVYSDDIPDDYEDDDDEDFSM